MKILKALTQSYIWIGLGAAATYYYSCAILSQLEFEPFYALFLWGSTTCLYNLLNSFKRNFNFRNVSVGILSGLVVFYSLFHFKELWHVTLLIPSVLVGILYGYRGGLRAVPYLKVFLIAIIWVYSTIGIPLIITGAQFTLEEIVFSASVLLFLLGITIPFDIRDIHYDSPRIRTLPQILGVRTSSWLAVFCVAMSGLLSIVHLNTTNQLDLTGIIIAWTIVSLGVVKLADSSRPNLYFTGLIDGLLILQGVLAFLFC